ncbi:hypothetical protein RSP822_18075 [Ralstonia solanacearum]|nr:hypothetical protein RSP822_18075 [Ralstonia solanacearum]
MTIMKHYPKFSEQVVARRREAHVHALTVKMERDGYATAPKHPTTKQARVIRRFLRAVSKQCPHIAILRQHAR